MRFFQDDFAGRVATKVMQTALAVRDLVLKVTEVLLYVGVYFTAALVMFAASDIRLTLPMLAWLIGYLLVLQVLRAEAVDGSRWSRPITARWSPAGWSTATPTFRR